MYKFTRVHRKGTDEYGIWYFKPRSMDDLKLHWTTVCWGEIRRHVDERFEKSVLVEREGGEPYIHAPHPTTQFGIGVDAYVSVANGNYALGMLELENMAWRSRKESFEKGRDIYLAEGMTVYEIDDRFFEIAEEVEKEEFAYPSNKDWTMDDVRYMQWNMLGNRGTHWYAKIGKRDVYDSEGNMKWETKEEAEKAAEWFLTNKIK